MKILLERGDESGCNYWDSADPSLIETKLNFQLLVYIQVIRMQIYIRNNIYYGAFSSYMSGDFLPEKNSHVSSCTLSISCYDFPYPLLEEKK